MRVLIGYDGSASADAALDDLRRAGLPRDVKALVIKNSNDTASAASRMMIDWAERELRVIGLKVSVAMKKGDAQRALIEEARAWDADSIFVGSRKCDGTFGRFWLGSVSTALVTKAHCSVEVVRGVAN